MKEFKIYNNGLKEEDLTDIEKSFLQAIVNEGEQLLHDMEYKDDIDKELVEFVDNHTFDITAINGDTVEYALGLLKQAVKVFPNADGEYILESLLFGTLDDLTEEQKEYVEKINRHIGTPYLGLSIYDDIRVFME